MHPPRGPHRRQRFLLIGSMCGMLISGGCKAGQNEGQASKSSGSSANSADSTWSSNSTAPVAGSHDDPAVQGQIESQFVIGPAAARDLDYRVAWQFGHGGDPTQRFVVQGDSAFTLDNKNVLTRVRTDNGARLWRLAAANTIEEIIGINFIGDRVYLTTGGAVLVLDAVTGSQIGKQKLEKIANTQPVVFDRYLIYGSRNGQVAWHAYPIAYQWKGYQIAKSIVVPPRMIDQYLVAVGNDGMVIVLNPATAEQYWSRRLLSSVDVEPAGGDGALFVAGRDQYLHAYDIATGRTLWKVLTESPLTESPVLVGDRVYQQIPTEGLVCFEAQPADSPAGKVIWKATGVKGNVLRQHRTNLLVWDQQAHRITTLDAAHGTVVRTTDLPRAKIVMTAGKPSADIFAASDDGRIVKLVPR